MKATIATKVPSAHFLIGPGSNPPSASIQPLRNYRGIDES